MTIKGSFPGTYVRIINEEPISISINFPSWAILAVNLSNKSFLFYWKKIIQNTLIQTWNFSAQSCSCESSCV